MRKLLMLATMLAMALFVASPALAQGDEVAVCHATGSEQNPYVLIEPSEEGGEMHLGQEGHEGDFAAPPGADSNDDCVPPATDDDNGDDNGDDVVVDDGDDGVDDDGDDVVIDNENNNTNTNVNTNVNNNTVVVNLNNFNQNVNFINIGGKKVEDFNKDGVITVYECKQAGVSKTAAVTFVKDVEVVTSDTVVEGDTIVVKDIVTEDTTVVTKDTAVVTEDTAVVTGDTTTTTAVLPETGGSSLLALGAGALLVAGGLLARRIVR